MSNKVRAKFQCTERKWTGGVKLEAVYSADPEHENKQFWDATPSGNLEMWVTVQGTADFFELGKEYYLDFTKAED